MTPSVISLPTPFLVIGVLVAVYFALRSTRNQHPAIVFLYLALAVRYQSNFLHQFMAKSLIAGQSAIAILTLLTVAMGLFVVRDILAKYKASIVIYAFIGVLLLSGLWNRDIVGTINSGLREMLSVVVILAFVKALDAEPKDGSFVNTVLPVFIAPLLLQLFSVIFHLPKASEEDGSISYIGGYVHEGVFSMIFLSAMAMTLLSAGMSWRRRTVLLLVFFVSILLANYRTAVLAALPMLFAHLVFGSSDRFRPSLAMLVRLGGLVLAGLASILLIALLADRMADIGVVFSRMNNLIKPPADFANADRQLFSGRLYIWNSYIFAVLRSDFGHLMLGFGPESWVHAFTLYAHNVFISYFYELGIVGLVAYLFLFIYFFAMAWRTPHPRRWAILSAYISFLVLCLGSMPTYTVEGIMFYSVIVGYSLYARLSVGQQQRFLVRSNERRLDRQSQRQFERGIGAAI